MKIQKESLIYKHTSIYNLFSDQTTKEYKELKDFLQTCDESFIFTLCSSDNFSICHTCHSIIDIHQLAEFLADDCCDKQTQDLLKPLLVVATAHQIDEIIF